MSAKKKIDTKANKYFHGDYYHHYVGDELKLTMTEGELEKWAKENNIDFKNLNIIDKSAKKTAKDAKPAAEKVTKKSTKTQQKPDEYEIKTLKTTCVLLKNKKRVSKKSLPEIWSINPNIVDEYWECRMKNDNSAAHYHRDLEDYDAVKQKPSTKKKTSAKKTARKSVKKKPKAKNGRYILYDPQRYNHAQSWRPGC